MNTEKILGFEVCNCNIDELINNIYCDYKENKQNVIININPEIVINNYKNQEYVSNLNKQKYKIPDGIGIVYASKINKGTIKKRVAGIDLLYKICEESVKYNSKIFLYGAKDGIAEKAKEELEKKYEGIQIVDVCNRICFRRRGSK